MQLCVYRDKDRGEVTGTLVLNETDMMLVAQGAHVLCEMLASNHSNCQILRAAESPHVEPGMPGMFWTLAVRIYVNLMVGACAYAFNGVYVRMYQHGWISVRLYTPVAMLGVDRVVHFCWCNAYAMLKHLGR